MKGKGKMQVRSSGRNGFTLLELTVVIAVLLILLALLFPILDQARQSAIQVKTIANMRQMLLAFTMYVNDNKEEMPSEGMGHSGLDIMLADAWFNVLPPYAGEPSLLDRIREGKAPRPDDGRNSVFMDPAFKMDDLLQQPANARTPIFPFSYNLWIDHPDRAGENGGHTDYTPGRLKWDDVRKFSSRFVIFGTSGPSVSNPSASSYDNMAAMHIHYRHKGGKNTVIGFADGHVAAYRKKDVYVDVSEGKGVNRGGPIWNPDGEH